MGVAECSGTGVGVVVGGMSVRVGSWVVSMEIEKWLVFGGRERVTDVSALKNIVSHAAASVTGRPVHTGHGPTR